jgi:serine/threonine protein kinase
MDRDRDEQIDWIVAEASGLSPDARSRFLDEHVGDEELREAVRARLEPDSEPDTSSAPHIVMPEDAGEPVDAVGRRIGQYKVKQVLASGGMGTVYLAMQDEPRRAVAVKLMKRGVTSRSALRRFRFEAQLLARLRHPGIAQIYEAGTFDDGAGGAPYFAMEYVPAARPLTAHAREKKLEVRQRLELFAAVCDAVAHGHQKGIIHRDLKPSNILVDSAGRPKIIDFGVARATDSDMAVTTLQTELGQLVGTLQYMSPEQCGDDPLDIDTSSDVYALGVVLYELLCEELPYDL